MKKLPIILFLLFIISCESSYKNEELKVIEDFSQDFLRKHYIKRKLNAFPPPDLLYEVDYTFDTSNIKVYISDALLPISQIKEDNEWMFDDNYKGTADSAIFHSIKNSPVFQKLEYREFDKSALEFKKPFEQFDKHTEKHKVKEFAILHFSRVCFDKEKENAIVVVNFDIGDKYGFSGGYHMALLTKKVNDTWIYIPRT